ncbi:hypothetical protein AMTRI_Chr04g243120 [Amborella trichopoda]
MFLVCVGGRIRRQKTEAKSLIEPSQERIKVLEMGRSPCCSKEGLNRGAWTTQEDKILTDYINTHGEGKWRTLPKKAGLKRCGKSCRLRWLNYLRPDIKRGNISDEEEDLIIRLHKLLGNRWSLIAGRLPGRTDNEIKNYWNTNLGKKVQQGSTKGPSPTLKRWESMAKKEDERSDPVEARVVRTKASRCTRLKAPPHLLTPIVPTVSMTEPMAHESEPTHCTAPKTPSFPSTFMDFDLGDLCIDTQFIQSCGELMLEKKEDEFDRLSLSPQQNLSLDGGEWMEEEFEEGNASHEFQSLAAFLDSEEDWLTE